MPRRYIYAGIVFGNANDPFLVNAAPRLISFSVGCGMAKFLVFICIVAQFFCGMASVTANSRMIYAFSRDGALPGSKYWHKINRRPAHQRTRSGSASCCRRSSVQPRCTCGTRCRRYSTAFFAMTGICVIGLYIAYAIPIYLRLTNPDFEPGPWNLKGHHKLVGWTALAWIAFITILFFAPLFWPFWPIWGDKNLIADDGAGNVFFKQNNFNFTGPLIVLAFFGMWLYWHLQRPQVVHWTEGAGNQGRVVGDRAGARALG